MPYILIIYIIFTWQFLIFIIILTIILNTYEINETHSKRESNMCLDAVATLEVLCVSLYLTSPPDVPFTVSPSNPPSREVMCQHRTKQAATLVEDPVQLGGRTVCT